MVSGSLPADPAEPAVSTMKTENQRRPKELRGKAGVGAAGGPIDRLNGADA
jgi:hypothetical protein